MTHNKVIKQLNIEDIQHALELMKISFVAAKGETAEGSFALGGLIKSKKLQQRLGSAARDGITAAGKPTPKTLK